MRVAWLFRPAWTRETLWSLWGVMPRDQTARYMGNCHSYAPAFRLVTVEAAREDYGVTVDVRADDAKSWAAARRREREGR